MKDKKHLLFIVTYFTLLILLVISIIYLTDWSLFSEKREFLYKITTPSGKTIEVTKVQGGATSLDYLQVKIGQIIVSNEIVYSGFKIDELYIKHDTITIQFNNSSSCINPQFIQASIE